MGMDTPHRASGWHLGPARDAPAPPRDMALTLCRIKHLHGVDKVGTGIEVVGPWLLQPPQAEDDAVSHGAGGEGAAAGHAGVARPAPCLQIEGLKGGNRQLALPAPCAQMRCCGCRCPKPAPLVGSSSRMGPVGCSVVVGGQHGATPEWTRLLPGPGRQQKERAGARRDAHLAPAAPTQDKDLVALQEDRGPVAGGGHGGQWLPVVLRWLVNTDQGLGRGVCTHSPQRVDGPICKRSSGEVEVTVGSVTGWGAFPCPPGQAAWTLPSPMASCHPGVARGQRMQPGLSTAVP